MFDYTEIEPLTEQELDTIIYEEGQTPIENSAERPGEQHAQRAARTIAKIIKQREREMGRIGAEIDRLQTIYKDRGKAYAEGIEHQQRIIEGWHRGNSGERTFRTGYGESKLKAATVQVEIEDEAAVIEWAESNDIDDVVKVGVEDKKAAIEYAIGKGFQPVKTVDLVKIRQLCPKLIKAELGRDHSFAEAVTDDGQRIPGVQLVRPEPTWNYMPDSGEVAS